MESCPHAKKIPYGDLDFFEKWVLKYRFLRKENFEVFFFAREAREAEPRSGKRGSRTAEVVQLKLHFSGRVNPFLPGAGADRL